MKVENMKNSRGNKVVNQFIIEGAVIQTPHDTYMGRAFQSYRSVIALIAFECGNTGNCHQVFLDAETWNYSVTTSRHRNQFLGETTKETQKKIDNGEYILADLN